MTDVFAITQIGMQEGQQRLTALANNAANAGTPGYKREVAATRPQTPFPFESMDVPASNGIVPSLRGIDLRAGALKNTGRALDVAIEGVGTYFGLTQGQDFYLTRAGNFRVDAAGFLVGEHGLRVQGLQGDIQLQADGDISIQANGDVLQNGQKLTSLRLFTATGETRLSARGGALLAANGPVEPQDPALNYVRSGYLEASNAGGPQEMLGLMATTRQFESLVRIAQGYDDALGRAIQKLGEI